MIMKLKIQQLMIIFQDGKERLYHLEKRFDLYTDLLIRLISEKYSGTDIKFVNVEFLTSKTFELFPKVKKNHVHYSSLSGGNMEVLGEFDLKQFNLLSEIEQNYFIWDQTCKLLMYATEQVSNKDLLQACKYALEKGKELKLNADYKLMEKNITLFETEFKASIWVQKKKDKMVSVLTLEENEEIIFTKKIQECGLGVNYFLLVYKDLIVTKNSITITGIKDAEGLPYIIPMEKEFVLVNK
jgi:hypothetical protein